MFAVRVPTAPGVKVTKIRQVPGPGMLPHWAMLGLNSAAFVPVTERLEITRLAFPELPIRIWFPVDEPGKACPTNVGGGKVMNGPTPVPLRARECGLLRPLSAMVSVACFCSGAAGLNAIWRAQLLPAAMVL